MLGFLLAVLRSNLTGGGGGGPFTITAASLSNHQSGTSCSNPRKYNVSLTYTGSPSGKTCQVERSWDGGDWEVVATGIAPTSFPYVMSVPGYYNKFGTSVATQARVTDEADSANTATSAADTNNYTLCV